MRIVPGPDRLIRDPQTGRKVDAEGITIEPTAIYWARLLADGDVEEAPAEAAPEAPADLAPEAPAEER